MRFLIPPVKRDGDGRPLLDGWVRRLLRSDSAELQDHGEGLGRDRRADALLGVMDTDEDAVADALAGPTDFAPSLASFGMLLEPWSAPENGGGAHSQSSAGHAKPAHA